ncbi:MAG TPA: GPP34 family phosphoprotein [Actinomycetes bacterium]|nr:GPP34 family phosphoprotein [Actinomycetes bacterium]
MDSIGAQLWLVGYDVGKGGPRGGRRLSYAITGGLLCDLLLRGKIGADEQWCRLTDPTPLDWVAPDDLLGQIAAEPARSRTWLGWVRGYARDAQNAVVEELEQHGRLVRYERRVLGVLALPRHSLIDPTRAERLRTAIGHAVTAPPGAPCERRLAALTVLTNLAGLAPAPAGDNRMKVTARADELEATLPAGARAVLAAVRAAIADAYVPAVAVG